MLILGGGFPDSTNKGLGGEERSEEVVLDEVLNDVLNMVEEAARWAGYGLIVSN